MSKSLGNVVNPYDIVKKYGTDAVRYYLLREIPSLDDGDFAESRMRELYNSDLANELGNCVSRLTTLGARDGLILPQTEKTDLSADLTLIQSFRFADVLSSIWQEVKELNKAINEQTPWSKEPTDRRAFLEESLSRLYRIGVRLEPFLPGTSAAICMHTQGTIEKIPPLFPRIQS